MAIDWSQFKPIDTEEQSSTIDWAAFKPIPAQTNPNDYPGFGPDDVITGDVKGLIEQGNINLQNRPRVKNEDGSFSTVRSMSFEDNGNEILIPTVSDEGTILSDEDAIRRYFETGKHLGKFNNPTNATNYAQALHKQQEDYYGNDFFMSARQGMQNIAELPESAAESFVPAAERGLAGITMGGAGVYDTGFMDLVPDEYKQDYQDKLFEISDALRKDADLRNKELSKGPTNEVGNVIGRVGGSLLTLGAGEAPAAGQDVIQAGGDVDQAKVATSLVGAVNAVTTPIGQGYGKLGQAITQGLVNPASGAITQAGLNEVVPEKLKRDPFDIKDRATDAIVGASLGAITSPTKAKSDKSLNVDQTLNVELPKSGDKDFDAGVKVIQGEKGTKDLFTPEDEFTVDLFSGEQRKASDVEQARLRAQEEPTAKTEERIGRLNQEYLQNRVQTREALQYDLPVPEPLSVPKIDQKAVQGELELPATQDLFGDLQGPPVKQVESIPSKVEIPSVSQKAPINAIKEALDKKLRETGQPLTREEIDAIRANSAKPKAPALTRPSVIEQDVKRFTQTRAEPPRAINEALSQGWLRSGDILDSIIDDVEGTYKQSTQFKALIGHLRGVGEKLGGLDTEVIKYDASLPDHQKSFELIPEAVRPTTPGWYDPNQNRVYVQGNPSMRVLVHETGHAITHRAISLAEDGKLTGDALGAYRDFSELFNTLKPEIRKADTGYETFPGGEFKRGNTYGMENLHEFFSEFYSNPKFREHLKSIKLDDVKVEGMGRLAVAKAKNLYQAAIKFIKSIFGMPDKAENALDLLISSGNRFLESIDEKTAKEVRAYNDQGSVRPAAPNPPKDKSVLEKVIDTPIVRGARKLLSERGDNKYFTEQERGKMIETGAREVSQQINRAFKKVKGIDQETLLAALGHKETVKKIPQAQAYASLDEKAKRAVDFAREKITEYQLRLAAENPEYKGKSMVDMLLDSAVENNYLTRPYEAFHTKPEFWYKAAKAFGLTDQTYREWTNNRRHQPEVNKALYDWLSKHVVIPDVDKLSDTEVKNIASHWEVEGKDAADLRTQLKEKANEYPSLESQLKSLVREIAEPSESSNLKAVRQAARRSDMFMERQNVPKEIRDFLGEYKDPRIVSALTVSGLGAMLGKQSALNQMWNKGQGKDFFAAGQTRPENATVKLPDTSEYGPLQGKYTTPEIAETIQTMVGFEKQLPASAVKGIVDTAWNTYVKGSALSKLVNTVGSVGGAIKNTIGNVAFGTNFLVRNALMGNMKGLGGTLAAPFKALKDAAVRLDDSQRQLLVERGIIGDGWQFGEISKVLTDLEKELAVKNADPLTKTMHYVGKGLGAARDKVADFYQSSDNATRLAAFVTEYNIRKQLNPKWSELELLDFASNAARDQVPTYSRASPLIKGVAKALGNFAIFPAEMIRTTSNQIVQAAKDIKDPNPATRYYGAVQLAGLTAQIGLFQAAGEWLADWFDKDDKVTDKDQENLQAFTPEYFEGDDIKLVDYNKKSGQALYMNQSVMDPSGSSLWGLYNRFKDKSPDSGLLSWAQDVFFSPGILQKNTYNAARGKDDFDRPMLDVDRPKKVLESFVPGTVKSLAQGEKVTMQGAEPWLAYSKAMGMPIYQLDTPRALRGAMYKFDNDTQDKISALKASLKKIDYGSTGMDKMSNEQIKTRYSEVLLEEYKQFTDLHRKIKASRETFGMSRGEIFKLLKETRMPKDYRNALLSGKFKSRLFDNPDWLYDAQREALKRYPKDQESIKKEFKHRIEIYKSLKKQHQDIINASLS